MLDIKTMNLIKMQVEFFESFTDDPYERSVRYGSYLHALLDFDIITSSECKKLTDEYRSKVFNKERRII